MLLWRGASVLHWRRRVRAVTLHRRSAHRHAHLSAHMRRWRGETRRIAPYRGPGIALLWWRGGLCCSCFDNGSERLRGDEAHKEESLKYGVGELWGLL